MHGSPHSGSIGCGPRRSAEAPYGTLLIVDGRVLEEPIVLAELEANPGLLDDGPMTAKG
jgi:hypothetical protein